jgi:competence protein ComEA
VLVDGEQILVGVPAPAGLAAAAAPSAGAPAGPLVNLNTATQAELESLPEVGPVTAQSILQWRSEHGRFSSVDELLEVDGIGDATLGKLAPYVTV